MKLTHCKLERKTQLRVLEFFVAQVTARSAAALLQSQPNSAALLLPQNPPDIIAWHLQQHVAEQFEGQIELDESYFGGVRKRKMGRAVGVANKVILFGMLTGVRQSVLCADITVSTENPLACS